jgi:hypothetical protein
MKHVDAADVRPGGADASSRVNGFVAARLRGRSAKMQRGGPRFPRVPANPHAKWSKIHRRRRPGTPVSGIVTPVCDARSD